jgi:transposase
MTRRYGRARGGLRVREGTPGSWRTLTILGAISLQGWVATMTIESPTDGDVFLAYLDQVLCPQLKPDQIVIMDNLAAHKVDGVRQRIEATGARLQYLPPYSPDFNPIERCWAQLKQYLRSARARTVTALESNLTSALNFVLPAHIRAYFKASGYPP